MNNYFEEYINLKEIVKNLAEFILEETMPEDQIDLMNSLGLTEEIRKECEIDSLMVWHPDEE